MKKHTHYIRAAVAGTLVFSLFPLQVIALAPQKIIETGLSQTQKILPLDLEQKKQDILMRVEEKKASAQFKSNRIVVKYKNDKKPFRVINLPDNIDVLDAVKKYASDDNVEYAEPDYFAYADMVPDDPYYSLQWHMDNTNNSGINAEEAWDISTGAGVVIAVIDTGIAYENYYPYYQAPDLASTCFVQGYDFINNDTHANDDNNHGTHVAGTIAQSTNNNTGVAGVAHDACLMPIKALDKRGSGSYTAIAGAIYYAVDEGAHVINMSLGGTYDSPTLENAVAYAYDNGVVVVAAAGNSNSTAPHYPSSYNEYVISVGATDYNKDRAPYSNYGPDIDIVAPGGDTGEDSNGDGYGDGVLQQTFSSSRRLNDFGYWFFQGTSMASPHVAGTVALLISNGNATTPDDIRAALESTAQDLGAVGRDDTFGYGLIDAAAALNWGETFIDTPPEVSLISPLNDSNVYGEVELSADATDEYGVIRVDFFVDETLVGTIETPIGTVREEPYAITWDSTMVGDGPYTITAIAVDTVLQTNSSRVVVNVNNVNQAPTADAKAYRTITPSLTISFDGSDSTDPDGTIVSYGWVFGDGSTGTGETVVHTYAEANTYTATLTVTDDGGQSDIDTVTVVAEQPLEIEVFYDSFEVSEWNGLWEEDYQNDWYRSSQRATDGTSYSAEVDGRAVDAALTSIDIDLQGYTNAIVTFDWLIEYGLDTGEYIAFDLSVDGGLTWTERARLAGNVDTENVWHQETIEVIGAENITLRFKGKMSNSREDANVDNVRVMAN